MRVLVASEAHFEASTEGYVYARGPEDYAFWSSYREAFDEVGVLARVSWCQGRPPGATRADGKGVCFHPLDDYRGPWEYLLRLPRLRRQVGQAVAGYQTFILRAPGAVAYLLWRQVSARRKPYAVEVLGDPWESLAPGRVASFWRGVARVWSRRSLRRLCRQAPIARYVTHSWLQQQYPPATSAVFSCSDVRACQRVGAEELELRMERIREAAAGRRPWEVGFIGSLERLYKAPDVLLRAVRICLDRGLRLRLSILGNGRYRSALELLAAQLGLSAGTVRFLGVLPAGRAVEAFLDRIDLFVLPSYTEGLPRALVEAMARGCPAIASRVGGIPELLAPEDLVNPGSPDRLAGKMIEALGDPARLADMARRNHSISALFSRESLEPVRRAYLNQLRELAAGCTT